MGVDRDRHATGIAVVGIGLVALAAISNEYLAARFLSSDGLLAPVTVLSIRLNQGWLATAGLGVLIRSKAVFRGMIVAVAVVNLAAFRTALQTGAAGRAPSWGGALSV